MDNILIKDTMECFLVDNSDTTNVYFLGINSKSSFVQKLSNTVIRGGIGNLNRAYLQTQKDATFEVDPILWNNSLIGVLNGTNSASGSITTKGFEHDLVVASGKVTLTTTTTATTCDLFDASGTHYTGTIATQVVTIAPTVPADGTILTAVFDQTLTGDITDLDAASFPKSFKIYSHTIGYNPDTNAIALDLYLQLNVGVPTGDFTASFEAGKESLLPIIFQLLVPQNSTSFGKWISVPRA